MTENNIVNLFTFSTFAESIVFFSTFITPLMVPESTGQKVARKITNTDTERNVGRSAIPYGMYTIGGIAPKNFEIYVAALPSLALQPRNNPSGTATTSAKR